MPNPLTRAWNAIRSVFSDRPVDCSTESCPSTRPPIEPDDRPVPPDVPSTTYTVDEYITRWEAENGRKMTDAERKTLARGCIGITSLNLGKNGLPNPPLGESYATLDQAKARADEIEKATGRRPEIFSKRFYSGGKDYTPDPKTGKVDMSGYDYKAKPGYVNFDYGFYDEANDAWWHANHCEPGMKVYRSTNAHYSRPLLDFDKQVYCVSHSDL